jgi:hypothetical protein
LARGGRPGAAGSRTKGLLMAFKLLEMAQLRWRRLDAAQLFCRWFAPDEIRRWDPSRPTENLYSLK